VSSAIIGRVFFAQQGVAQAKNGDELFWERKILCSQWEA
jgi:hypothetical protein